MRTHLTTVVQSGILLICLLCAGREYWPAREKACAITSVYTYFKILNMENAKIRENTDKLIKFVATKFEQGELNNDSLLELFKVMGCYLNLKTIPDYAKANKLSYQGVKSCRQVEEIFGVKFVIDNK